MSSRLYRGDLAPVVIWPTENALNIQSPSVYRLAISYTEMSLPW